MIEARTPERSGRCDGTGEKPCAPGVKCGRLSATLIEFHGSIADHDVTLALGEERQ